MGANSFSSREFSQDASRAKRAARHGPVFITDRGKPAHVLLTIEEYRRLSGKAANIVDLLADADAAAIEFDMPKIGGGLPRPADLS